MRSNDLRLWYSMEPSNLALGNDHQLAELYKRTIGQGISCNCLGLRHSPYFPPFQCLPKDKASHGTIFKVFSMTLS